MQSELPEQPKQTAAPAPKKTAPIQPSIIPPAPDENPFEDDDNEQFDIF
jgi:hypothetical protein